MEQRRSSWLSRVRERFAPTKPVAPPANMLSEVESWIVGRPSQTANIDPRALIDQGYRHNVVVYVCVNEIAQAIPQAKLALRNRDTKAEVDTHPVLDLLAKPAPNRSGYELLEAALIYQQTVGDSYLHKGRNGAGEVIQLTPVRPDRLYPVASIEGIGGYEYRLPGQTKGIPVAAQDIVPLGLFDPLDPFHGLSPLKVAAVWGALDAEAAQYLLDFFTNGAMPMGLLRMKSPTVRDEDRKRVQMQWQEQYGHAVAALNRRDGIFAAQASGWHSVAVLSGDVEFQALGSEPQQLRLDAVFGMSETRICAAYGIPPIVVGMKVGMTSGSLADGSKIREARRTLWTETLVPIGNRVADALTRSLLSEYPGSEALELYFETDGIPELQEDLNERGDRAAKLYLGGLISRNEGRKMADFEEEPDDFIFEPGNGMVRPKDMQGVAPPAPPAPVVHVLPGGAPPTPKALPAGEPPATEPQRRNHVEILGRGVVPKDAEALIEKHAPRMSKAFLAAVEEARAGSSDEDLRAALLAGDRKAAFAAVDLDSFVSSYKHALKAHLERVTDAAAAMHYQHHLGAEETQARSLKEWARALADRITSRVKQESARFERGARTAIRSEVLAVLRGEKEAVDPARILNAIGLSAQQAAQVSAARERLKEAGKKGTALEKELDRFKVKLLRERAERIAQYETRLAESLGQAAAWESMILDGTLKGGRRHWHKLWQAAPDDGHGNPCPICEELDGEEVPLDALFDDEYNAPPDPHDHCRCRMVLVEAS